LSRPEGNRAYVLGLLVGLARIGAARDHELFAYAFDPASAREALGDAASAIEVARLRPALPGLRVAVAPVVAAARDRFDLWPATFAAPPVSPVPFVLAVHDALFATRPDLLPRALALRMRLTLPSAIRRAARVLAPTEAVKRDLVDAAGVDPARVVV